MTSGKPPARPSRILVVDDEPGMLRAVERTLGRRHTLRLARSGQEALAAAGEWEPELAILDIRMPDLDGFELTARLKERLPDIDVILMTGSMSDPDEKLVRAIREKAFYFIHKPFDTEVLKTLVDRCLDLRRLEEENRRHTARLEEELAEARAFQRSLLPAMEAEFGRVRLAGHYESCSELGGDLLDYEPAGPGCLALVVADVSGHGASAAMLTGVVKAAFHTAHAEDFHPLAVVQRVQSGLQPFAPDRFFTLFAARIDEGRGLLEYVGAGHPAPLLWRPGEGPLPLESTGPIISAALPGRLWSLETRPLLGGEKLLVYTDGLSEALSEAGEMFGDERILAAVHEHPEGGSALITALLRRLAAFTGGRPVVDDVTLLGVEFR